MDIRKANQQDVQTISTLAEEIWWPTYSGFLADEQVAFMLMDMYSEAALQQQMKQGFNFLLAERKAAAVAFAAYSLTLPEEQIFKLEKLYVLPSEQGKGTGKLLIDQVIELARQAGGKVLELNVNRKNPAFNFYKKLGFEVFKKVDIPYHHFVLNDYVMRKSL